MAAPSCSAGRRLKRHGSSARVRLAENAGQQALVTKLARSTERGLIAISRLILASVKDGAAADQRQENRCSTSSPNTPTCRSSRWSATVPISIPTAARRQKSTPDQMLQDRLRRQGLDADAIIAKIM